MSVVSCPHPLLARERITDADWEAVAGSTAPRAKAALTEEHQPIREWEYLLHDGSKLVIGVEGDPPDWAVPTFRRLGELLELAPNWDSYGACPINPDHARAAIELLMLVMQDDTPAPTVVPTNRGGVQLEWHTGGIDLEIETLSSHRFLVSFEDSATEREWELTSDFTPLVECIGKLSRRA